MDASENEFFPTPPELAKMLAERALWQYEGSREDILVLEPSAGTGAWLDALRSLGQVVAVEPHAAAPEGASDVEWFQMPLEEFSEEVGDTHPFHIALGNPPFSLAEAHLRLILKMLAPKGICGLLLRIGFLSSKKRRAFFAAYPPKHIYVLPYRPSFAWSWKCNGSGCKHEWMTLPDTAEQNCPECGSENLSVTKTDKYDYMFAVWQPDMPPGQETRLTWLAGEKEESP